MGVASIRTWKSPAWPISRPAPGWDRRAASRPPCSRRCTAMKKNLVHPRELAEQACHIELDMLGEPIGKQDQYIAAYGGITCFEFQPRRPRRGAAARRSPRRHCTTSRTICCCSSPATTRSASAILKEQDDRSKQNDKAMIDNLHFVKELGYHSKAALEIGRPARIRPS